MLVLCSSPKTMLISRENFIANLIQRIEINYCFYDRQVRFLLFKRLNEGNETTLKQLL